MKRHMKRFFYASNSIKPSFVSNIIRQSSPEHRSELKTLFLKEIGKLIAVDKKTITSPTAYLLQYQEACMLSDSLVLTNNLVNIDEKMLSRLYAQYADALNTFNAKSEDLIKESVEKSLVFDPENQLAKDLKTTLDYSKIPEAFFVGY
jgi:hypothetical protein